MLHHAVMSAADLDDLDDLLRLVADDDRLEPRLMAGLVGTVGTVGTRPG